MPMDKFPGNDGLTVSFYKHFWPLIGKLVIESLNEGYENTELSESQKQSVITLISKPGKDNLFLKNWRPISLMNVDAKLGSKCIADRVKNVLPSIVSVSQCAFIKGRNISDCARLIDEMFTYTEKENIPAIFPPLAIDIEKAFDSVEWDFHFKFLHALNFSKSITNWVHTFYVNPVSCVMNNATSTGYFNKTCGVRQGDPLSPCLSIIVLESLLLEAYADDLTCFLTTENSCNQLIYLLNRFISHRDLNSTSKKPKLCGWAGGGNGMISCLTSSGVRLNCRHLFFI